MTEHFVPWLVYFGVGLACLQFSVGIGFTIRLLAARIRPAADAECGRAAIVLCLRGADPFLERCLAGILTQDYPDFEVVIIVDHRDDPAWEPVHALVAGLKDRTTARAVRVTELRDRPETCSLKNASLVQAYESLGPDVAFVATVDADVEPHRTWLRELVAPMADPRVGATTGNRWYMPDDSGFGSLVRYQWNAGAVVPMFWHGIAWGGSVALRASFVRDSNYRDRMRHALCEDTMLFDTLGKVGLKLRFVPSILMINRESIAMPSFFRFCRRQMLISGYHSQAWAIWVHGLTSSAFYVVAVIALGVALVRGDVASARTIGTIFAVFLASMALVLPALEFAVRRIARLRGEASPAIPPAKLLKIIFTLLVVTQLVYGAVVWSLVRVTQIEWRGIYYRLRGLWNVHRENYAPYRPARGSSSRASLAMNEPTPLQNMTPGLMRVLKLGLFISTFGWGISFFFTVEPWSMAVDRLYQMGAEPIPYQPLLAYWLKMASAVFGCLGVASAFCFLRPERLIEVIRLLVPLHLIVGATLIWAAAANHLDPTIHKSFVADIAFCFSVAGLIGVPLFIAKRRAAPGERPV